MRTRIKKNLNGRCYLLAAHVCNDSLWLNPNKVTIRKIFWN